MCSFIYFDVMYDFAGDRLEVQPKLFFLPSQLTPMRSCGSRSQSGTAWCWSRSVWSTTWLSATTSSTYGPPSTRHSCGGRTTAEGLRPRYVCTRERVCLRLESKGPFVSPLQVRPGTAVQMLPPRRQADEHQLARLGTGQR